MHLPDYDTRTPLFYATMRLHYAAVEFLLEVGGASDIGVSDARGSHCLLLACRFGSLPMLRLLLKYAHQDTTQHDSSWPLALCSRCDKFRTSPTRWAVVGGYDHVLVELVLMGVLPTEDDYRRQPRMLVRTVHTMVLT